MLNYKSPIDKIADKLSLSSEVCREIVAIDHEYRKLHKKKDLVTINNIGVLDGFDIIEKTAKALKVDVNSVIVQALMSYMRTEAIKEELSGE